MKAALVIVALVLGLWGWRVLTRPAQVRNIRMPKSLRH